MREINTKDLKTRVKIKIDGHDYTVRRLGAGEQLQLNQYRREHASVSKKSKQSKDLDKLEAELDRLQVKMLDMFVKIFDDGADGTKSKNLVYSLDVLEITELLAEIFAEEKQDEPKAEKDA